MLSPSSGNTVIKSKLISRRMFLLTVAKVVVMGGIIGRLVSLQINERTKYKTLSDKNRFREWKLAPERGVIKDFFVRLPGRNDDRTIEDMNNYVLRGNIYIQFNKDDSQSLVELNLTDILSELSLLTSSIQDVIIPT